MYYSPTESEQLYYQLRAHNTCQIEEANRIGPIYLTYVDVSSPRDSHPIMSMIYYSAPPPFWSNRPSRH